jgi:hypothetical protein
LAYYSENLGDRDRISSIRTKYLQIGTGISFPLKQIIESLSISPFQPHVYLQAIFYIHQTGAGVYMNQYFRFAKNNKKAFLLAPLLVIVDVICEIVQPVLMSKILDTGISHKDIDIPCIMQVGVLMVGLSLLAI